MSDLQKGDWVTVTGKGPYKVVAGTQESSWLICVIYPGKGLINIPSEWCVKVPPPSGQEENA